MRLEEMLESPVIEAWKKANPWHWWAFQQLGPESSLKSAVVAAVLSGRHEDESIDQLVRFGEALENRRVADLEGCAEAPPQYGERRPLQLFIKRMKRVDTDESTFFRVDFATAQGWSGHFDTKAPEVVERIAKHRRRSVPLTVIAEVVKRPHDFLVVLGGRILIV